MVSSPLSFAQLELLWEEAGGPQAVAPIAAAIALAESGGNPFEVVSDPTQHDPNAKANGLWQINTGSDAHPEFTSWNLTDPMTNAIAAVNVWKSGGFGEWSTYSYDRAGNFLGVGKGVYLSFMQGTVPSFVGYTPGNQMVGGVVQVPDAVRKIGIIVFGVMLVVIGASVFRSGQS